MSGRNRKRNPGGPSGPLRRIGRRERQLSALSRLTKKRPRRVAREELLRIALQSTSEKRARVVIAARGHHETVPAGIRVLLRELHDGKCQLCSFTFEKRSGEPYFEIHHLEASIGHHPSNLLVICPNCHAQLEHALVTNFERSGIWLIAVTINGKRIVVRQPLLEQSVKAKLLAVVILALFSHFGRALVR